MASKMQHTREAHADKKKGKWRRVSRSFRSLTKTDSIGPAGILSRRLSLFRQKKKAGDDAANVPGSPAGKGKKKIKRSSEARSRRRDLARTKGTLHRLKRRVDGFWYSRLPFAGPSGFRRRVLLVSGL